MWARAIRGGFQEEAGLKLVLQDGWDTKYGEPSRATKAKSTGSSEAGGRTHSKRGRCSGSETQVRKNL